LVRNEQRFRIDRHASLLLRTRRKADPLKGKPATSGRPRPTIEQNHPTSLALIRCCVDV
jgi:hypothetical protein